MAKKIHTRRRRYAPSGPERNRKKRFKTFKTEDQAKAYAEKLKLNNYKVVKTNYGLGKKFKVVLEK